MKDCMIAGRVKCLDGPKVADPWASVSSASEFIQSLFWQPTRAFKLHTMAISALAIVPYSQIILIKV